MAQATRARARWFGVFGLSILVTLQPSIGGAVLQPIDIVDPAGTPIPSGAMKDTESGLDWLAKHLLGPLMGGTGARVKPGAAQCADVARGRRVGHLVPAWELGT